MVRDHDFATIIKSEFRTTRPISVSYKSCCFVNHGLVQVEIRVGGGILFLGSSRKVNLLPKNY